MGLTGDTLILTDKGDVPVSELVGKQFNVLVSGKSYPSTEKGFQSRGVTSSVYKVKIANNMELSITLFHKIRMVEIPIVNDTYEEVLDDEWGSVVDINGNKDKKTLYVCAYDEHKVCSFLHVESATAETREVFECEIGFGQFYANKILVGEFDNASYLWD